MLTFEVRREDISTSRVADVAVPDLAGGEALLRVDSFACSANNITYAGLGQDLRYWDFFPADDGWGRIPSWGLATVTATRSTALQVGKRVFGFVPMSTHLLVLPGRENPTGFTDMSVHRTRLPGAYNAYRYIDSDPIYDPCQEGAQAVLRPVFYLSFFLDDYLEQGDMFGAETVLLTSASSKAALGAAFLIKQRGVPVTGLTSPGNRPFVESLSLYDELATYDELEALAKKPSVLLDIAGSATVRDTVQRALAGKLRHSVAAGAASGPSADWSTIGAGDQSSSAALKFFVPDQMRTRVREWGGAGFDARFAAAWRPFADWCATWLTVDTAAGPGSVKETYSQVLAGKSAPENARVLSMWPDPGG